QAADLVKYCNKEKGYNIKYWEIGNEPDRYEYQNQPNYSVEQYIDEFMDYYHAMKAVDPSIKIMGSNPCVARKIYEWLEPFLAAVGTNCSVGTSHFYPLWANAPDPQYPNYPTIYNLLRYDTNDWTNSGMLFVERFTKDMRNMMDKYSPGGEIGITEFSTASGGRNHTTELGGGTPGVSDTQAAAVWAADVLGRFGRNGVDIANYWIMASTHDQSFAMILEDWSVRPIYYTYFLYANHFGNKALYTKSSQDDKVSIHASKSSDGSKLYLMIINKDVTKTKSATVKISGFDPSYKGASYLLSSTNASSDKANINGWEINKNDVVGSVNKLPADIIQTGKNFNIILPPCSVACIEIGRAGSENPGINITFPKEGDTIGGSIRVSADAIPSLGSVITKVEFQADENQPVNDSSYPFEILWNTSEIAEGMHTLYAKMYCNDGSTFTASVNVSVKRNLVLLEGTKIRSDGVANDFKLIDNVDQLNNYATFDLKKKDSNAIIEFSKPVELELIKIHFWDGNPAKYTFRLECSVNCSVWLGTSWLGTTLGNSSGNSSLTCNSGWQSFNFSNEKVRFVRLVSENTTADKFRVIEFQVFGKFLDPPNALIANVTPTYPIEYENITFIGKLEGPFPLMNASWISNIDGILEYKEDAEFNISDFESKIRVKLSPGKHNITFKATDLSGLEDFANYELTVFGEDSVPKVFILNLSSNTIQRGDTLKADAEFEDSENDILEIFWFSNIDGLISTNSTLEVSNLSKGVHEISLRARDSMGFWSNESKMVIEVIGPENKIPVAQIVKKSTHATVGKEITFEGKGIDEDGTIIRYEWYSDKDGLISTSAKFSTKNLTKGEHNISFRVCDNEGAWSENATFKIKIEEEQKNSMCGFYLTFNLISILLVVSLMTLSVIYSKVYPKINGRRYKLSRKYRKYKKKTRDLPENIKFQK
ncbi:MAG: Ig-like domain-containing protein, partial [Thermoplasmata archaeon]